MVRTAVAAASAAHRARANRQSEAAPGAQGAGSLRGSNGGYNGTQGYGTITNAHTPPASYGVTQPSDHHAGSLSSSNTAANAGAASPRIAVAALPASDSYHGQLHRADSPTPGTDETSDAASTTSSSSLLDETSRHLPSYADFKLAHYLLDLPLTLLILSLFLLLAVFGWPVPDSPYPHHIHWKQLGLGAITWISTEAIRRRIFRFLGSSRYPVLRSTAFLLLLHTFIQELLRLFAIRLTFHNSGDHPDYGYPLPSPSPHEEPASLISMTVIGCGLIGPPPRPPKGFFKAFHLALGFAAAENIWQTLLMLGQVRLYEEVLSPPLPKAWLVGEENLPSTTGNNHNSIQVSPQTLTGPTSDHNTPTSILDDEDFVTDAPIVSDEELEGYIRERKRIEFEDSFGGVPLWDISVFVIGMWRLDATLLNLSLTLLLSLPFHHNSTDAPPRRHPLLPVHLQLWPTFFAVVLLHWLLSLAWTLGIRDRRRFSLAGISYVTLVGVLGTFFASLGVWSALI